MKFSCNLPVDKHKQPEEFLDNGAVAIMAKAAEAAGFSACAMTDHPAPVTSWVEGGGHHALDPFVGLAFAAAATTRLKLHTNIIVAPYRNPFVMAKLVATLDRLSGGRTILGMGTGYMEAEFDALGVTFADRGAAMDEAIQLMKEIWTGKTVNHTGKSFRAEGVSALPTPVQKPHPLIWSGGNSHRAIRRAVDLCDGWSPFPVRAAASGHVRTEALETIAQFKEKLDYARDYAAQIGRTRPLEVCMIPFCLGLRSDRNARPETSRLMDECFELAALGVTWVTMSLPCKDRAAFLDNTARFGAEIIPKFNAKAGS